VRRERRSPRSRSIGEIHDGRVERDLELERREPAPREILEPHLDAGDFADREGVPRRLDLDPDRLRGVGARRQRHEARQRGDR